MDNSTIIMMVLVLIALAAALVTFGLLRERGRSSMAAGCAAVAAGILVITGYVAYSIVQVLS